jgi:signal transduction histidine kinase
VVGDGVAGQTGLRVRATAGTSGSVLRTRTALRVDDLQRLALVEDGNRISQELHDGVIQSLYGIALELETNASDLDSEHRESVKRSIVGINRRSLNAEIARCHSDCRPPVHFW